MRRGTAFISGCMILGGTVAMSQIQSPSEEYNRFRDQIMSDYYDFKIRILEHYDDFLNGEWHEFEPIWESESPYTEPKPEHQPAVPLIPGPDPEPEMAKLPTPVFDPAVMPGVLTAPRPGSVLAQGGITGYTFPSPKIDIPDSTELSGLNVNADLPGGVLAQGSITGYTIPSPKIDISDLGGLTSPSISASNPDVGKLAGPGPTGRSNYEIALLRLPDPGFAFGPFPGQTAAPSPDESGLVNIDMTERIRKDALRRALAEKGDPTKAEAPEKTVSPQIPDAPELAELTEDDNRYMFDFYGMDAYIPEVGFKIKPSVAGHNETGSHWKYMAGQDGGVETARQLFGLAQKLGLNGYLTFRLTEAYVNSKFKESDRNARMSAVHFLLSNMGYDIRLLMMDNLMTVMMPFDQEIVYGSLSSTANNGRKYTILFPEGYGVPSGKSLKFITCDLPSNAGGKTSDLRLTGLNLPVKARDYSLTDEKITVKGEINENIRKILYRYPQMPNGDYASSWIDGNLRDDLIAQLRSQLEGKSQKDAVNALLSLCHNGFQYKVDQDWHGFEKPYFLEESLLYDYNDCEDRAIFLSYLLWNALNLPCQILHYPEHASTAVAIDENIPGYYYLTDGMRYYSADPTFIGSNIGMVMSAFTTTVPQIDKQYK